jgi:hypothetical protein
MEGVPEDKEDNPGGRVAMNEDDDNNNSIEDKDEAPVNGEDDLVAISLSILPANLNTGEMELRVVSATAVRIWRYPDKRELIIPTGNPLNWSKRWPVQQMPPVLYVEGTSSTIASSVLLSLTYWIDGQIGIDYDDVTFTVVRVKITYPRDTNLNGKIDDPENEFSYNAEDPAVLQFYCSAATTAYPDNLRWTIEDIGAIRGKWYPHVDGDEYTGKGSVTFVTFTEMPANNSDFGPKIITLRFEGLSCTDQETIEVFFQPTARNHLGGASGNVIPDTVKAEDVVIKRRQ